MSQKMTLDDLQVLINKEVADVLTGEGMLEMIRDNIAKSLEPFNKANDEFKRDLLGSIDRGFKDRSKSQEDKRGLMGARMIRAMAAGRKDQKHPAQFAKEWGDETLAKALSSSEGTEGGFLLQEAVGELIELLRAVSVVRSLNPVIVPMEGGTIRMPKHTAGSAGSWIGENTNAPMTKPAFGSVVLTAKKYASLVPISNDLLRRASPQIDMVVRDDLVADIATATDISYIRGVGTSASPKGLRHQAAADNIFDRQQAGAASTLAEITGDLVGMLQRLMDANVRMLRIGWIMEPRTWARLISVRDGNGNLVFQPEMARGTLWGYPFRVTSQIPRNLGGGDETELYLADFADVLLGETTNILIDTSTEAAYFDGSNVQASFSLDQTVVRALVEVDLAVRHPESVVILTAVDWSPADA